jgi:gamma-glutamylcyclotransferase (GGCT)/AIG2-like uncharacterized protein YtfP
MSAANGAAPGLFAYGTLQLPEILAQVVGRSWPGSRAELRGYRRFLLRGKPYPAVVAEPGARVPGLLYPGVSPSELELLDDYEGELYERRLVTVQLGQLTAPAFVYVLGQPGLEQLAAGDWDLEKFAREHLSAYLAQVSMTRRAP